MSAEYGPNMEEIAAAEAMRKQAEASAGQPDEQQTLEQADNGSRNDARESPAANERRQNQENESQPESDPVPPSFAAGAEVSFSGKGYNFTAALEQPVQLGEQIVFAPGAEVETFHTNKIKKVTAISQHHIIVETKSGSQYELRTTEPKLGLMKRLRGMFGSGETARLTDRQAEARDRFNQQEQEHAESLVRQQEQLAAYRQESRLLESKREQIYEILREARNSLSSELVENARREYQQIRDYIEQKYADILETDNVSWMLRQYDKLSERIEGNVKFIEQSKTAALQRENEVQLKQEKSKDPYDELYDRFDQLTREVSKLTMERPNGMSRDSYVNQLNRAYRMLSEMSGDIARSRADRDNNGRIGKGYYGIMLDNLKSARTEVIQRRDQVQAEIDSGKRD